ncbi:MAG: hypothetical protein GX552_18225 [Chloroflexi bacterium]|nr:hypothetical protein [Chloroflexota bacterium]
MSITITKSVSTRIFRQATPCIPKTPSINQIVKAGTIHENRPAFFPSYHN